jgi:hypothetical protein
VFPDFHARASPRQTGLLECLELRVCADHDHVATVSYARYELGMAYDIGSGYAPGTSNMQEQDASLPMFNIERVSLQFNISSDFVAAAVANNVLILALSTGRILRIDLDSPADIDGS